MLIFFPSGPPRFEGDRPRFGDREGYRAGPRGPPGEFGGEKGGAPADYQPSFSVSLFISYCLLHNVPGILLKLTTTGSLMEMQD